MWPLSRNFSVSAEFCVIMCSIVVNLYCRCNCDILYSMTVDKALTHILISPLLSLASACFCEEMSGIYFVYLCSCEFIQCYFYNWAKFDRQQQQQRPFDGLWSGTTRVGRYQKKHSPTHTHPDHRASFIIFLHLQRSMASSLFNLRAW